MTALAWAIVGLGFASGAMAALAVLDQDTRPAVVSGRLREIRRWREQLRDGTGLPDDLAGSFAERLLIPLLEGTLRSVGRLLPKGALESARKRLYGAGVDVDPARFVGAQAALAVLGAMAGAALGALASPELSWRHGLMIATFGTIGWRLPGLWVARRRDAWRAAVSRALPDVLDILSVSVEAGLGFDSAMQQVAAKFPGPVAEMAREYLLSVHLGWSRADALRQTAEWTGVPELRTFAAAVIQAERLGVPMARVLKAQADAIRVRRKQRAEERAMQLPLKLLFPLVLFIFPTLFIVLLGPAVIQILTIFS